MCNYSMKRREYMREYNRRKRALRKDVIGFSQGMKQAFDNTYYRKILIKQLSFRLIRDDRGNIIGKEDILNADLKARKQINDCKSIFPNYVI